MDFQSLWRRSCINIIEYKYILFSFPPFFLEYEECIGMHVNKSVENSIL